MVNVRFYRLETLPSFVLEKHNGIFVHVTKTMGNTPWKPTVGNEVNPATLWMTPEKSGESVERINLVKWLSTRHIETIESGLWFGGENGWELLSNETNSAAINAAIDAKIATLNVEGYAQATISGSTLTISGIKETNGKIEKDDIKNLVVAIDGTYNESTNKIATQSTVTTAIEALDVNTAVQAVTFNTPENGGNTTLTFKGVKEVDGKIVDGNGTGTFIVGDAKLKIQIGSDEAGAFEVFSANKQTDSTIKLDGYVFKKDENNIISVITETPVSENNKLVTKADINNLAGAMHYRGGVTSVPTADNSTKKGDVWIVTTAFTTASESYEAGDMFIARADGANATFDKVQGNITLGTGDGQIAKNVGVLANGNMVIATENGIKTINITETQLTSSNDNTRKLTYDNGTPDTSDATLFHSATIKDTFKVIGKDFIETINISSTNRSIKIARNAGDNDSTGVVVDLVWNTTIE